MAENREIIQQWQYLGRVPPKLLEDKAFGYCKQAGITSLQSYLYWAEIEKEPGKIDFSSYDVLVEKLKKHNLKWIPFLILGPDYATPKWFQESEESVFYKCLEHKKESKIQSIWNPFLAKWVDRFLRIVSEHYQDKNILESICLGISGNWGEAIYPATGGFYGNFHTHLGWWCGDEYATQSFREYAIKKYGSLDELNNIWKTNFSKPELIDFPNLRYSFSFSHEVYKFIPNFLKSGVKFVYNHVKNVSKREIKNLIGQQWWLDFVAWYINSMTNWTEFWLKTGRKYFPNSKIYLVTGGIGQPILGADFSAQTKMAAKYDAGIRITNQTNDYSQSFILSRLVSAAARFYNSYFTTEEAAIIQNARGIIMRLFDTISSGARGFYCKNIISIGKDPCIKKNLPIGQATQGTINLAKNLQYLTLSEPIIKVAVFFPSTSIAFEPLILDLLYEQCSKLRDVLDFDLLDENMVRDGALENYKFLVIIEGKPLFEEIVTKIEKWIESGGIFISQKSTKTFPVKNNEIKKINQGYRLFYFGKKQNYLEFIKKAVYNQKKIYSWQGIPLIDEEWDRVYATRFSDKIIYYNANNFEVRKKIGSKFIEIKANSIICES